MTGFFKYFVLCAVLFAVHDMAKSRAEIQKAYRQRLKEKSNEQYLAKERERRRSTYVPNGQLSKKKREERNKKNRAYLKRYRQKRKENAVALLQNNLNQAGDQAEPSNTSGYESAASASQNRMVVRINFPQRANGPRMRISKELDKAKKEVKAMKEKFDNLKRKYRSIMRAIQREKRKACHSPSTPRSKAAKLIHDIKLTPKQSSVVQKELVFANAVCDEIKSSARKAPIKQKKTLQNLVVGDIVKKYKFLRKFGAKTGMSRNTMAKVNTKGLSIKRLNRSREVAKHREKVIAFFERDDNSRNMPGKSDYVKPKSGHKTQKRVLTDYLSTLYDKFISENAGIKLSLASFCRIRPQHIVLTSLITRDTCLCTKHQNMSLTLKAVKRENVDTPVNGEKMLERKSEIVQEIENKVTSEKIVIGQWKRVQIDVKGQTKSVMKIVDSEMTKAEFLEHIKTQTNEFEGHVKRIQKQYNEMKRLKENLPANHCIVHMDFSENYSCKSVQEIQSAYWNQTSVTLHPIVIYYKLEDSNEILHKSIVVISDEMGHNASTVLTIIDKLIPEVKGLNPDMTNIHYWTDGPTSQYRNKVIFHAVANHVDTYGIAATWNYWEAGHGKGPCDGLGGTVKRMADDAVKTGKVAIQDPTDFYCWTQSIHCTMKIVKFIFVSSESCQEKAVTLAEQKLKPISGTMKLHAAKGKGNSIVAVRETSCYCETCIASSSSACDSWRNETIGLAANSVLKHSAMAESTEEKHNQQSEIQTPLPNPEIPENKTEIKQTDFVAAIYLDKWYIGQVINTDPEDNTFEISFLEQKKKSFQWPHRPDIIWVERKDILCEVSAPQAIGKSKRMLSIDLNDITRVEALFFQR